MRLPLINFILPEFRQKAHRAASQNLFGSLELGIWILFGICNLTLEIFYIPGTLYTIGILIDFFNVFVGQLASSPPSPFKSSKASWVEISL